MDARLYRSATDRVVAGVAGGMAETYNLDPALVRVGWALLILLTGGVFLVLYIIMALVVPIGSNDAPPEVAAMNVNPSSPTEPYAPADNDAGQPAAPRAVGAPPWQMRQARDRSGNQSGPLVIGLILIVVGVFFLARQFIPALDFGLIWPVIVIAGGVLLILAALARPDRRI